MTVHDLARPPGKYRLTVSDYLTLDRAGAFEGMRTELIEGEVIVISPQYRRHGFVKAELAYRIRRTLERIGSNLYVLTEGSVDMSEHDMPQPDITLTREPRGEGAIPLSSVGLVVEVADASLNFDLERKAPLYARASVAEYWVVDVNGRVIHQMWAPSPDGYRQRQDVSFGHTISAATIESLVVETGRLD